MIGLQGGLFPDYLPESGAQEVYGGGRTISAGNFAPTGQAVPVEGGYRLSGHWTFASGCRHASWFICGALVMDESGPRLYPDGAPQIYLMFVPATEVTIIDAWHTGGLRGTGSHDFEARDVFVPDDRCFLFALLTVGPERQNTGYTQPFMALAAPQMAAVALGIARDAIESFKALAAEKTPTASSSRLQTQTTVREKTGHAEAMLGAARSYLLETNALLAEAAHPDNDLVTRVRLASAYAARSAEEVVQLIYAMGGGTAIYNRSRLDRCFRDVHTVSHHILLSPSNFEMAGQYLLTGELPMRR
jgi:alkylation response protein AidB-like acyl-CoA dehydrogenase